MKILTPRSRRGPAFPWWIAATAVLFAILLPLASNHLPAKPREWAGNPWALVLLTVSMLACVAAAGLGGWLEARCYVWLARRHPFGRLLGTYLLPPVVLVGVALVVPRPTPGLTAHTLFLVELVGIYWFLGSALGTSLMVTIDVVVSALVQRFRSRVLFAVSSLLVIASAGAALMAGVALYMVRTGHSVLMVRLKTSSGRVLGIEPKEAIHHPLDVAVVVFLLAAVLFSPVVLSALSKLAESVTERIYPLTEALDAVAGGRRDVRVEEAGSVELIQLAHRFNRMVEALGLAERMEHAFGMYVGSHVMRRIREQHGEALLPASSREATVLFADIRGFTSMSEQLAPEAMITLLNRYFDRVVSVVDAHDGYLNKFIGDAVMVIFNGPLDQADHPERAVRCAIAIQEAVEQMASEGAFSEAPGAWRVGIGIATGSMVCGNVGGGGQVEYTVIGDVVNLASRLTGSAGGGEVWVNDVTAGRLPMELLAAPLPPLRVKGKAEPVVPYRVWPRPSPEAAPEQVAGPSTC